MKRYPPLPRLADAPELLDGGHLWLLEKVDGGHLRFRLRESGVVQFGDGDRVFGDPGAVPGRYRRAVRHVRERLDREALRAAVDDVTDVVFFAESMHRRRIDYDWARTPPVLGFDVWSAAKERFYPPDVVEGIFGRLGLRAVNAVERERHTRDFDPDAYVVPDSAWYDGPAEGVVVRDKRGRRAKLLHPTFDDRGGEESGADGGTAPVDPELAGASPAELAAAYATERRFERLAGELVDLGRPVTFDALFDRVVDDVLREKHGRLCSEREPVDMAPFRSAVAARLRSYLEGQSG